MFATRVFQLDRFERRQAGTSRLRSVISVEPAQYDFRRREAREMRGASSPIAHGLRSCC